MIIRNTTAAVLFSTLVLASGATLAATQQPVGGASFESQLSEAANALHAQNSGSIGREEILITGQNLQIARDLSLQGRTGEAQGYLDIARGTLGLDVGPSATELAGAAEAAFSGPAKAVQALSLNASTIDHNSHGGL